MVTEEEPTPKEQPKEKKVRYMSPKKEIDKKKKRIERLELLMQECQNEIAEVDRQIASPEVYSDYQKLTELQAESDAVRQKSDEYEEEWTTLMLELEELEAEAE